MGEGGEEAVEKGRRAERGQELGEVSVLLGQEEAEGAGEAGRERVEEGTSELPHHF